MLLKTRVDALYTQEKIACDMGKLAKTEEEKKYYKEKSVNYPPPKGNGLRLNGSPD